MKSLKNSVEISGLWVIGYDKLYIIFIVHCELYIIFFQNVLLQSRCSAKLPIREFGFGHR